MLIAACVRVKGKIVLTKSTDVLYFCGYGKLFHVEVVSQCQLK